MTEHDVSVINVDVKSN